MHKKSCPFGQLKLAEEVGFEPTDPLRSTVFKTAAFDRSANFPKEVTSLDQASYNL